MPLNPYKIISKVIVNRIHLLTTSCNLVATFTIVKLEGPGRTWDKWNRDRIFYYFWLQPPKKTLKKEIVFTFPMIILSILCHAALLQVERQLTMSLLPKKSCIQSEKRRTK